MHPAPSVILFTVASGMGFGLLAFLALGAPLAPGWPAFLWWGLGYALAVGGLVASTFHLGNPQRALRAFTQWRTSWLSREAWASVVTLLMFAPVALSDWLGLGLPRTPGLIGAVLAPLTVLATSMIYAQLKTVPRWNHWSTPLTFLAFALTGGAILSGAAGLASLSALILALVLITGRRIAATRFAQAGATIGSATGLGAIGAVTVFEQGHTTQSYVMREMIHVVGRRHAEKLYRIALILATLVPGILTVILPHSPAAWVLAALSHATGALAGRWLFFAEAEHVVGLYYDKR